MQMMIEFRPAAETRAYRTAVEQVCDAIMCGDLKVGDMLPPEREMAVQIGISRTSVREAIRVLADAGVVSRRAGAGGGTTIIRDVIPVGLLSRAMELSQHRIMDMLEVRGVLEVTAAELAAQRATVEEIDALEAVVARGEAMGAANADERGIFVSIESMFHLSVARATHNEVLVRMNRLSATEVAVAIDMIPFASERKREFVADELSSMTLVLAAIRSRDSGAARSAMAAHLSYFPPIVEAYFRRLQAK
jgi:GntR family transcriptional regulator, transcriptional repressor for pyruvate dehydrogenase complex